MREFMLLIKAKIDPISLMSPDEVQNHIGAVSMYIEDLVKQGKFKSGQPLEDQGLLISGNNGYLKEAQLNGTDKVIRGYYHIVAKDLNEASAIAKLDPRFNEVGWQIEIRPILKMMENAS